MVKRDEMHEMSGDHFTKLFNAMYEVAEEIGTVTLPAVADYMAIGINSLRDQRACA